MRVLFMITRDWLNPAAAGGDIVPSEYGRYLASKGHSVVMLVSSFPGALQDVVVDGVRIIRLGSIWSLWVRTFVYYMRHCRGQFNVVVEEGFGGSRIPRFAPLYVREPIITEWHQIHKDIFANQYHQALSPFLNYLEHLTARLHRDTLVRAGTREWKEEFVTFGFKRENIAVIPVSIRAEWLAEKPTGIVSEPSLIWLGKFRRYKCVHHVILAMKAVVKQKPNAHLMLVGRHDDKRYEQRLQQLVLDQNLSDNIQFRFNVTEEEKKARLESCRALILPSAVEGFGVVVLEANACGTPVIASRGVPIGAVRHGYNGLRYDFGDIETLSHLIIQMLNDDYLYTQLSANSLAFAKRFEWCAVGMQFEALIQRAVQEHK